MRRIEPARIYYVAKLVFLWSISEQWWWERSFKKLIKLHSGILALCFLFCFRERLSTADQSPLLWIHQNAPDLLLMVLTWEIIKRIQNNEQLDFSFKDLTYLIAIWQSTTFVLEMEILVDAERRVLKYMEPQIACVGLGAELKVETAQQVMMDLHLYRLLVLHMHTLYFKCGRIIKPFLIH